MRTICILLAAAAAFGQTPADQPPVERAYALLNTALQNNNPVKRAYALQSMGIINPDTRYVGMVEGMLGDKDLGVRQAACSTLGEMQSRGSISKLKDMLNDAAPEVVFAAARALYNMGDPAGRAVLIAVLAGDEAGASGAVSASLREAKLTLHDPKAMLIIGAKAGVSIAGFGLTVPIADRLLKDRESSGKTASVMLLSTDSDPRSKEAIRVALSDKNWTVRVAALRAVATRGLHEYYDDVVPMLDDKNDDVEYSAASAVIRLRQTAPAPRPKR
jgi:HEAT repeat protein